MTDFYKFIKCDKILENIRPHVQAVSPKAYTGAYWSIRRLVEHILKVCNVVLWFELMENFKNNRLLYAYKIL